MADENLNFLGLKTETKAKDLKVSWKKPVGFHNPKEITNSMQVAYQKNENFILDSTKSRLGLKWPMKQVTYFACGAVQDTLQLAKTGADLFFGDTTMQKKWGEHIVNKYKNSLKYEDEKKFDEKQKSMNDSIKLWSKELERRA
ncbi:MAG: hypothetical protein N4A44_03515 [Alphaproteobacteria bacterium]|jgi:hypothetical protein|nr:hypothetical protein [Alphaproteobacteria bacterium]